jgi:hypothetical protein
MERKFIRWRCVGLLKAPEIVGGQVVELIRAQG